MSEDGQNESEESNAGAGSQRFQSPWSRSGWSTDKFWSGRDHGLDKKVEESGRGILPGGYYEDRPGLAISPLMHNPYMSLPFVPLGIWIAIFLFDKLREAWIWGWIQAGFFLLAVFVIAVMAIIRIPGWHRARRMAKDHIAEKGGKMPPELRWYT